MQIAIVENTKITHHGQVGVALHEAGARVQVFRPWLDGVLPKLGQQDGLVVFGGEQNARADDTHPYLPDLAGLMAETAAQDHAVLGICLGSQVLARGLGAENHIGTAPEFGWTEITRLPASEEDPVMAQVPGAFPIFQWHSDTYSLPPGAVQLATGPVAKVQCFRAHRAAYGMQFHFEANRRVVADWTRTFPEALEAGAPGWLSTWQARAQSEGEAADRHGLALARAWVELV